MNSNLRASGRVITPELGKVARPTLAIDGTGNAFLYASFDYRNALLVSIDAKGTAAWEKFIKGDALYPTGYIDRGRLLVPMMAKEDAVAAFMKKGTLNTGGIKTHPVVFVADPQGKLTLSDVLTPAEGTRQMQMYDVTGRPDFTIMARTGKYVDFSYAKDRPGLIVVDLE